jgi:hypothetical protein
VEFFLEGPDGRKVGFEKQFPPTPSGRFEEPGLAAKLVVEGDRGVNETKDDQSGWT